MAVFDSLSMRLSSASAKDRTALSAIDLLSGRPRVRVALGAPGTEGYALVFDVVARLRTEDVIGWGRSPGMGLAEVIAGRLADGDVEIIDGGTSTQLQADGAG